MRRPEPPASRLRRLFRALIPYWPPIALASTFAALHSVFSGILVWLFGPLMMTLFQVETTGGMGNLPGSAGGAAAPVDSAIDRIKETLQGAVDAVVMAPTREETLVNFCLTAVVVVTLVNLFSYSQSWFMAFVQQSVMKRFRDGLFEKYQRLSLDFFHQNRTGRLISRITNDVVVLNDAIDTAFNRLIRDSMLTLILVSFLVILSWQLTLLTLIVLPIGFLLIWYIGRLIRRYSDRSQERMADVSSVLEENVSNMRIVKAFGTERYETNKFAAATHSYFRTMLKMIRMRNLASPVSDILATAAGAMILLYAGQKILAGTGDLSAGDFMTYILALFSLIKPVKSLTQIHVKLQEGMAAANRVYDVLDEPETVTEVAQPITKESFTDLIRYEDIHFRYQDAEPVLDGVSFDVARGQVVAIVGPSGAGKSTLVDLLPRFYDPQQGVISVDGINVRRLTLKSLRGMIGMVTQETHLFNDTIRNNIAYGLGEVPQREIEAAAEAANAHAFITQFEYGYDTVVSNRGARLSGGQRQRLAIARALLKNPDILILDEATSSLDTESETLVQQAIDRLVSNRTVLVIAHRLSTVRNADRILVLEGGTISEHGSHDELIRREGTYARLYSLQFRDD